MMSTHTCLLMMALLSKAKCKEKGTANLSTNAKRMSHSASLFKESFKFSDKEEGITES